MLQTLAVRNYRSLRDIVVPLGRLNVVSGANGSGKSNIYKSLRLLADTARGGVVGSLAREGGLTSTLWAGPESHSAAVRRGDLPVQGTLRKSPISLGLGFVGSEFSYCIDLGLAPPSRSIFALDPVIKGEFVWAGPDLRAASMLVERRGPLVRSRDAEGAWQTVHDRMSGFDSILAQLADPRGMPELLVLREQIRSWRFYDHFRTDVEAPSRTLQVATRTPVLTDDGSDLASALQTIREEGDAVALDEAVNDAFPGARLDIEGSNGRLEATLHQHGLLRSLRSAELSDGTLRYLLWVAALLSARPASLSILNEPETSLHPDLLPALGRLIVRASQRSQVLVVTHANRLLAALEAADCTVLRLEKNLGETQLPSLSTLDRPRWQWPSR